MLFLIFSIDCLYFASHLYEERYNSEPTTTFYFHWYYGQSSTLTDEQIIRIKYTQHFDLHLNTRTQETFEQFKLNMARTYPDLIENAHNRYLF